MSIQSSFFSEDHDDNPYASSHAREQALNRAIVTAEISRSYEEYLEIFDRFYAEDIEVSSATRSGQIRGKARVSSLLWNFLVPLHIMAEVGGVSISTRQITTPGDAAVYEHHYDEQQRGGPLTEDDFRFADAQNPASQNAWGLA
jgi:hypothetical protein